ncbi:hypothetical protein KIL84_015704 [Mauremys mutica]|uniref:Uncharacterized protein n=1 Tax=Mauremys mutica TaxID=74926 RepID=A0A9D3WSU3_9SAUR|nr:hypothetical protein KIL84_015704 [Mauremys mutica]
MTLKSDFDQNLGPYFMINIVVSQKFPSTLKCFLITDCLLEKKSLARSHCVIWLHKYLKVLISKEDKLKREIDASRMDDKLLCLMILALLTAGKVSSTTISFPPSAGAVKCDTNMFLYITQSI